MKKYRDLLIILGLSTISFLVAYFIDTFVLNPWKENLINTYFSIQTDAAEKVTTGEYKAKVVASGEGLKKVSDDIIIIGIDDISLQKLGRFPFSRDVYVSKIFDPIKKSSVVIKTNEDGKVITNYYYPSAIFLDIVFSEYTTKEKDELFFNAIRSTSNTVVDYMFVFQETSEEGLDLLDNKNTEVVRKVEAIKKFAIPDNNVLNKNIGFKAYRGNLPVYEVSDSVSSLGFANIVVYFDQGDTYNSVPMVIELEGKYYPSIVLVLLCMYYKVSISNVYVDWGKQITIKNAQVKLPDGSIMEKDVVIPVDKYNRFFVNYVSRSSRFVDGGFRTLSLYNLDQVKSLGRIVDGKILMTGMLAYGYGDIWKSPLSPGTYGIEHIANALNNIILKEQTNAVGYVSFTPNVVILALTLVIALIVTLVLSFSKRLMIGVIFTLVLLVGIFFVSYLLFQKSSIIFLPFLPALTIVFSYAGGQTYLSLKERAQRLQIKGMLDSYVSPEVVNILIKHPEKLTLGGEDRDVTVFFSDIRGFTSLSEGLTPQELVSIINKYLSRMTDIIMDYRGTVDKYIGDAIMAFWGAPLDDPDHPLRACQASLEMLKALGELNAELPPERQLDIGIGINTGIATIGNMGSTKKKNYTAMGDTVNLASRLEGVNKMFHTRIIISESTFERVKDKVIARQLDVIRVKGKKQPVKIYELIGMLEDYKEDLARLGINENKLFGLLYE